MLFHVHSPLSSLFRSGLPPSIYIIWGYDKDAEKDTESDLEKLEMSLVVPGWKEGA